MEDYRSIVNITDEAKGFINLKKFEQEQEDFRLLCSGLQAVVNRGLKDKAKEQNKENLEKLHASDVWKQLSILVKEEDDLERELQGAFFGQKIRNRLSKIREEAYKLVGEIPGVYHCSSAYSIQRSLESDCTVEAIYVSQHEIIAKLLTLKNWKNKSFDELVKYLQPK